MITESAIIMRLKMLITDLSSVYHPKITRHFLLHLSKRGSSRLNLLIKKRNRKSTLRLLNMMEKLMQSLNFLVENNYLLSFLYRYKYTVCLGCNWLFTLLRIEKTSQTILISLKN